MPLTVQEIAARLPELTGGPHDDDTIVALAAIAAEAIRILNHATRDPVALGEPATADRVLAELATAADRLPQLLAQLTQWLAGQYTSGQLVHDTGQLDGAVTRAVAAMDHDATLHAARLAEALNQAHQATAGLYRASGPDQGGEPR